MVRPIDLKTAVNHGKLLTLYRVHSKFFANLNLSLHTVFVDDHGDVHPHQPDDPPSHPT